MIVGEKQVVCEPKPPATVLLIGSDELGAPTLTLFPNVTKQPRSLVPWGTYKGDVGRAVKIRLASALSSRSLPVLFFLSPAHFD